MLFVIYGFYQKDAAPRRAVHVAAHKAFLADAAKHKVEVVMSGPLVSDDGATPIGSLIVVEAADRAAAETFHHADPFYGNDIWESTAVTAFDRQRG